MLGSYPTTEYFDIEETGPQFANSQRLKVYIKKSLTEDPLKTHVYLVRLLTIYGQYLVPEAIILVLWSVMLWPIGISDDADWSTLIVVACAIFGVFIAWK